MKKWFPYPKLISCWSTLLFVFIIYLVCSPFFGIARIAGVIPYVVTSLFVPLGPITFLATFPLGLIWMVVLVIGSDWFAWNYLGIRETMSKIVYNLFVLLLTTLIIESLLIGTWPISVYTLNIFNEAHPLVVHAYRPFEYIIYACALLLVLIGIFKKNFSKTT